MCPLSFITYLLCILFFILQSSHSDDEDKKNPQPRPHENPQHGADDKPKTTSEIGHFTKEDKNTFNCALLFNTVFMLCILLYRIGNGGNKLFVFCICRYITEVACIDDNPEESEQHLQRF